MARQRAVRRGALGSLLSAAAWAVVSLVGVAVLVAVLVPRIAGATPYAVLTSSMSPTHPAGSLVVVRPVDPRQIGVGEVITYQLRSGEPMTATHRVVAVRQQRDGDLEFLTRGDANAAPDPVPVRPVQVRGTVWYSVPHLGRVQRWLPGAQRQAAVTLLAVALAGYALVMFAGAARDRWRREAVRR